MAGTPVLETRGLTIRFGGHVAVNAVSCGFEPGTLTAIVGPNGAGKTTYFNLISGQLPASAGQVLLFGEDVTRDAAPIRSRSRTGNRRACEGRTAFSRDSRMSPALLLSLTCSPTPTAWAACSGCPTSWNTNWASPPA